MDRMLGKGAGDDVMAERQQHTKRIELRESSVKTDIIIYVEKKVV
jgi:hypothetical protein